MSSGKYYYSKLNEAEDKIKGYEKANLAQGNLITTLRSEVSKLKDSIDHLEYENEGLQNIADEYLEKKET